MAMPTTAPLWPVANGPEDLPRQAAADYWAGRHGEIVKRSLPGIIEYVQHHFSPTDHGFWPATQTVGTQIPATCGPTRSCRTRAS